MLINEVTKTINASYNTIRKQILKDSKYYTYTNNILLVSEKGYTMLQDKYGIRAEVMTEDNVNFYKVN